MTDQKINRFTGHDVWALVAADTFDPLVERITKMLSHDRRMVKIHRYVDRLDLTVHPGLRLRDSDPIKVTTTTFPTQTRHFEARMGPGLHGLDFSAPDDVTEADLRPRWDQCGKAYNQQVTAITLTGRGTEPQRDDRIDIEHWNEHRVGQVTTYVFQCDWDYGWMD